MRKTGLFVIAAMAAFLMACGGTAENKPANAPANTATKTAAAPTAEALFDMEKKANEAWFKGDKAYFDGMLSDKFVSVEQGQRMGKAELLGMIGSFKCDVKSWNLEDPKMSKINDDTYAMSYKGTFDGTCTGPDAKAMKIPSPNRAASVWVRNGDKWQAAFHGETLIIDPKNPPAPPAKEEAKKEEPKADEKKTDAKTDDKAASNSNAAAPAPAKPTPSTNTDALVKIHTAGWEAWKSKDAKWFDTNMASGFAFVDPMGGYTGTKAEAIKIWTETMKCEGVTKVSITDGFASAISPTVELLTLKGSSDGTCDGQKNGPLYQAAVYVKEGDAWKLAFMFESPAM